MFENEEDILQVIADNIIQQDNKLQVIGLWQYQKKRDNGIWDSISARRVFAPCAVLQK